LRLDGTKIYVTNGGFADMFTLLVSSPGLGGMRRGQSLVWVDRQDEGVVVGAEEHKLGLRGSSTVTLNVDGVRLAEDRVIGGIGAGAAQAAHVLAWGRTAMASGCVGTCRAAIDLTTRHARGRVQFGKPLTELPVVRAQIALMVAKAWAAKALVRHTTHTEAAELVSWSTSAKVFCSRTSWSVCDTAVQLHGGSGYIEETGASLLLRDTRVTRIFEGANDVLLGHAGATEVLSPRDLQAIEHPMLHEVNDLIQIVAQTAVSLRKEHGMRLLRRPRLLHQFGDMVVLRDAAVAAAWRAIVEDTEASLQTAALFLHHASQQMRLAQLPTSNADLVDGVVENLLLEARP